MKKPSKAVSSRQRTFDGRIPKGVRVRNHRLTGAFCVRPTNINMKIFKWIKNQKVVGSTSNTGSDSVKQIIKDVEDTRRKAFEKTLPNFED